jgi:PAS domain S-box-containing protein
VPAPTPQEIAPEADRDGRDRPDPGDRFARLLDQSGQPFILVDEAMRIARVNPAFESLLGRSSEQLLGRTVDEITPERWRGTTAEAIDRLHLTRQAQRYEKEYLHADGTPIPVSLVTDFDRDESGRVRGSFAFVTDIRERKRAEEALRASEERFRQLYDEAPFGYHVIDSHGVILSVNRTECELLGYEADELVGRSIFDFIVEGQREAARWALAERVRGERPVQEVERVFRTKDGRERIFAIENRQLLDREGRVVGVRGTMQDITRRKRAEAALVSSERRLRALFEGIEDAIFVHDLHGRILDANPAACRRLGYTREEFLALNTRDIDDPDFSHGFADRLEEQLRHGRLSCEGRHRAKDGRLIPVDINTSLIQFEDQTAVLAVIRDITERKALEETRREFAEVQMRYAREAEERARELARSEGRYRGLTEGLLDAVVVTDSAGRITLFNHSAERVFGHDPSEVLGRDLAELIPDDPACASLPSFQGALKAADPRVVGRTVEAVGLRRGGEAFPVEVSVAAVGGGPAEFVASIRDLTERNRMRAMLMQTEKLASIGLLSAGVAHEINNPLAFIANNLAVLDRDLGPVLELVEAFRSCRDAVAEVAPEAAARAERIAEDVDWEYVRGNLPRMLARTRDGVQRVAAIVQNLRGLARTSPPVLEPVALSDLIDGALEMVSVKVKRAGVEVTVDRAPLPKIACVPSQIGQVFLNLLVNAVQAIEAARRPEGGHVRVALRAEPGRQVVEISDDGPGIAPEAMSRLFDPFFTTKPVGEGTGLGLAISHGIVTGHGGTIEVRSTPGQGATFLVALPTSR